MCTVVELEGQGYVDINLKIAEVVLLNKEMDLKMVRLTIKKMGFNLSGLIAAFLVTPHFLFPRHLVHLNETGKIVCSHVI